MTYDTTRAKELLAKSFHAATDFDALDALATELRAAIAEVERLQAIERKYYELLYAVANITRGESRHETALRYITHAETPRPDAAAAAFTGRRTGRNDPSIPTDAGVPPRFSQDASGAIVESFALERIDIIGQNGNDGLHYQLCAQKTKEPKE